MNEPTQEEFAQNLEAMTEEQEQAQQETCDDINAEENADAMQQQYYWYVISEFYGMLKVFGNKKVLEDLNTFKKTVDLDKDKPRIHLVS